MDRNTYNNAIQFSSQVYKIAIHQLFAREEEKKTRRREYKVLTSTQVLSPFYFPPPTFYPTSWSWFIILPLQVRRTYFIELEKEIVSHKV